MKFPISRASGSYEGGSEIEFTSLEELMNFISQTINQEVIISPSGNILIYDDHVE